MTEPARPPDQPFQSKYPCPKPQPLPGKLNGHPLNQLCRQLLLQAKVPVYRSYL